MKIWWDNVTNPLHLIDPDAMGDVYKHIPKIHWFIPEPRLDIKRYREAIEEAVNWHNAEARRATSKSYRRMHLERAAVLSKCLNPG
jgi:hypothetical protein